MKKKKGLIFIISVLIITEFISLFITYKSYNDTEVIKSIMNVNTSNNVFSIKVQNKNSSSTYDDYNKNNWPDKNSYTLNTSKTICKNEQGSNLPISEYLSIDSSGNIKVKSSTNLYCNLYFDIKRDTRCGIPLDDISTQKYVGLYRYQGSSSKVNNNYICIGTFDKSQCLANKEKYLFRIIGVTEDCATEIFIPYKLGTRAFETVRADIPENGADADVNKKWSDIYTYKQLNGLSSTNDIYTGNIFINSSKYDYVSTGSEWYNRIMDYDWSFGLLKVGTNAYKKKSTAIAAINEWDINKITNAKIGGIYVYDYSYSTQTGGSWCFSDACTNSWLYSYNNLNLMSYTGMSCTSECLEYGTCLPSGNDPYRCTPESWIIENGKFKEYYAGDVYAAFYLKPSNKINSGYGTQSDPYILDSNFEDLTCQIVPSYDGSSIKLDLKTSGNVKTSEIHDASGNKVTTLSKDATGTYYGTVSSDTSTAQCSIKLENVQLRWALWENSKIYYGSSSSPSEQDRYIDTYYTQTECTSQEKCENVTDGHSGGQVCKKCVEENFCPAGTRALQMDTSTKCYS